MITIVVCSANPSNLQRLLANIEMTAKYKNEILAYNNLEGKGLCEVYNLCAYKAQNNFLCFVHDDVLFHTQDWDELVVKYLEDEKTGMVGVLGGRFKSRFGVSWNDGPVSSHRYNIKNGFNSGKHLLYNPADVEMDEAICLDGAFLCCKKQTWQQHKFDENTFSGFHFYDLDICLQTFNAHLKNYVVYGLVIEHFSNGRKERSFLNDFRPFADKWKNKLPLSIEKLSRKEVSNYEGYALTETIQLVKRNKLSMSRVDGLIRQYFSLYKNIYQLIRILYFRFIKN